jgi:hypothetical protein
MIQDVKLSSSDFNTMILILILFSHISSLSSYIFHYKQSENIPIAIINVSLTLPNNLDLFRNDVFFKSTRQYVKCY